MKNKQNLMLRMQTCWMAIFILLFDLVIAPVSSSANIVHTQQIKVGNTVRKTVDSKKKTENVVEIKTNVETKKEAEKIKRLSFESPERLELKPTIIEYIDVTYIDYWTSLSLEEQDSLLNINQHEVDSTYNPEPVSMDDKNFDLTVKLVFGEAGFEDFAGKCLVAQSIRDTYLNERSAGNIDSFDLKWIKAEYRYSGKINHPKEHYDRFSKEYQECIDAVTYILTNAQSAVKHRLVFFYAPDRVQSKFHESQDFVVEHGGHRFFDNVQWQ